MGLDLHFIITGKNKDQMQQLKEYIRELQNRDFADEDYDHKMCGYGLKLFSIGDNVFLAGEHRNCIGQDLGYWMHREDKDSLMDGCIYMCDKEDFEEIYIYGPGNDESGMISSIVDSFNPYEDSPKCNLPEDIFCTVYKYFKTSYDYFDEYLQAVGAIVYTE